jgi:hypothetical protein
VACGDKKWNENCICTVLNLVTCVKEFVDSYAWMTALITQPMRKLDGDALTV